MRIESIADQAKRHIEVWIIKGEYEPGRQLKEEEISARLGISRPPVREAFKMMEAEGLVVRRPHRGVFVSEITAQDIWEAYTLKAALYEMATGLAVDVISESEISKLDAVVGQMENCIQTQPADLFCYQEYHQIFHDNILIISGHERLKKISAGIHNQVGRISYRSLQNQDHLRLSLGCHRKIVNALKAKDKILACRLMKEHVLKALEVLLSTAEFKEETTGRTPCAMRTAD